MDNTRRWFPICEHTPRTLGVGQHSAFESAMALCVDKKMMTQIATKSAERPLGTEFCDAGVVLVGFSLCMIIP